MLAKVDPVIRIGRLSHDPTLLALREQLDPDGWQERLDEAERRAELVRRYQAAVASGASREEANRRAGGPRLASMVEWEKRYRDHGVAGLIDRRGRIAQKRGTYFNSPRLPDGHVSKTKKSSSFLRWVGGKRQLLPHIRARLPSSYGTYFEPMAGSAVVFFALAPKRAVLADVNDELMSCFSVVRDHLDALLEALSGFENTYERYLEVRRQDPNRLDPVARAARTIFLNKTCYNGLYRVNSKGRFNVPYGWSANVRIRDEPTLRWASAALQGVRLTTGSVEQTVAEAKAGDIVYLDPPYLRDRAREASRFHAYQPEHFDESAHVRLAELFRELDGRGCHVLLSNSDLPRVRELYAGFRIDAVGVTRTVNRKGAARTGWRELLICNTGFGAAEARSSPVGGGAPHDPEKLHDPETPREAEAGAALLSASGGPHPALLHAVLFGYGVLERKEAIRVVHEELCRALSGRDRALRPTPEQVGAALDRATRSGRLRRPGRGLIHAVEADPRRYAPHHWDLCIEATARDGQRPAAAIRRAAKWACAHLGLPAELEKSRFVRSALAAALHRADPVDWLVEQGWSSSGE